MSLDRKQALQILEEAKMLLSKTVEEDESDERGYWLIEPSPPHVRRENVQMVMRRLRSALIMLEADEQNQSESPSIRKTKKKR